MATAAKKTAAKKTTANKARPKPQDAIAMLRADHAKVSGLFAEFEQTRSSTKKMALVGTICTELSVHAQVEEEVFYPAVKAALKVKSLIPEAVVEQATMKALIGQIEGVAPDGEMYDARVKVLAEYVKHHVKEEHTEMFPRAKATRLDMAALGAQMAQRKAELMASKAAA
jgi:hemerythrin superfamily protein